MSIQECLADRLDQKRLFEVVPLLRPVRARSVWVTKEIQDQLDPDTALPEFEMEAGRIRRKLDDIVCGERLVVGDRKNKDCDLKCLETRKEHDVWEIRDTPEPSIRIFFSFLDTDCFVATNIRLVTHLFAKLWSRHGEEFWPVWREEIRRCKAAWRALFHPYPPHSGDSLNDYLSNADDRRSGAA